MSLTIVVAIASALTFAAQVNENLSRAKELQQRGNLDPARAAYEAAQRTAIARHNEADAAAALMGIAQIDLALGRYKSCIAEAFDATAAFRALGNHLDEARTLTTLGQARFYSGNSSGALADFGRALELARVTGEREREIVILSNIGNTYFSLGQYAEALQQYHLAEERLAASVGKPWRQARQQLIAANLAVLYQRLGQYSRALRIYTEFGRQRDTLPAREQAQLLSNIGTLYRRLGDPVTALEKYRAAEAIFRQSSLLAGEVGVLNNIGIAQTIDLSNPAAASDTFTRALVLAKGSGGQRLVMTSLLYRGEAFLRSGDLVEAGRDFAVASGMANDLHAPEEKWKADYGAARVAAKRGDLGRSNELLRGCIATIESLRKGSSSPLGKTGFFTESREVYDLLIEHEASAGGDTAAIFKLMEQSRARDLQDHAAGRAAGLDELRKRLAPDTLLLEYSWSGASLIIIPISHSGAHLIYRKLAESDISVLNKLPAVLADATNGAAMSMAYSAGRILLEGVTDIDNASLRHLIVVPDGGLARIPFEALPALSSGPALLIDRFSVSYLPFGCGFRGGMQRRAWSLPWQTTVTAFADPYGGVAGQGVSMPTESDARLPGAEAEARYAASAVGGRAELHIGSDALKHYLTDGRNTAPPLLHFATHAFADPEDPDRSYVLFAPANGSHGFDYLFLREAAGLSLANVKLVTLSACDSGAGKLTRGEGIESFGAAFLSAGAQAVLTSLWRTGDHSSAEFITRFYDSLAEGKPAADALREAKLFFRRSTGSASHPAYWAGFVLTGDSGVTIPRTISWKFVLTLLTALLALSLGVGAKLIAIKRRGERVELSPGSRPQ